MKFKSVYSRFPPILFFAAVLFLVIWAAWLIFGRYVGQLSFGGGAFSDAGQVGDSFGVLNSLFTMLGFLAVLATFQGQSEALKLQQDEIDQSRKSQHQERFESSFFELLGLMRELRENIDFYTGGGSHPGATYRSFGGIAAALSAVVDQVTLSEMYPSSSPPIDRDRLKNWYTEFVLAKGETGMGPYFRVIYTMLDRLRSDKILPEEDKIRMSKLLRSQLNGHEVTLAALNGLSDVSKDFSVLLTNFKMLKYMPGGPMRDLLETIYPPEAFAPRAD
ncbi:MAG: hypothetical protein JWP26_43 [Devosia sp.]|uniref:putative phage abortive infection protein n=1 Tax=Devosia sp. TaxID=1871048 RepID=UPI00260E7113|nr:putative phage abortive infection protein [Devosia sp.]MDB5585073.1 hypothetical protein [Devosia sp.]